MNFEIDITIDMKVIAGVLGGLFFVLRHEASRKEILRILDELALIDKYQRVIGGLLAWLEKFYGPAGSRRAFFVSLMLAFVYPLLFFLIGYAMDGPNTLAGEAVVPDTGAGRWLWALGFSLFVLLLVWLVRNAQAIDGLLSRTAELVPFSCSGRWLKLAVFWGALVIIIYIPMQFLPIGIMAGIASVFWGALVVGRSAVNAEAHAVVNELGGAGAAAGVGAISGALVVVSVFAGVTVLGETQGSASRSLVVVSLFIALPLFNALLDWLSWFISRRLLQRAQLESKALAILSDIGLDTLAAVGFMLLLLLGLPALAIGMNMLYGIFSNASLDWVNIANLAHQDPWGEGSFVTLMLITTLIPTAIHLLLGMFAIALHLSARLGFRPALEKVGAGYVQPGLALARLGGVICVMTIPFVLIYFTADAFIGNSLRDSLFAIVDWLYGIGPAPNTPQS